MAHRNPAQRNTSLALRPNPHVSEVLKEAMAASGLDADGLAKASGVGQDEIELVLDKRRVVGAVLSEKLSRPLGIGKQRLYKVHIAWMDSCGR